MDTQALDDLNKTIDALSLHMGLEGGFGGRHDIENDIASALEKRPLSQGQKNILKDAADHGTSKLALSLSSDFAAKAEPNGVTAKGITHLLTDGIAKKIQNIRLYAGEGLDGAESIDIVHKNLAHLTELVDRFKNTVGIIMGHTSDFALANEHPATGRAVLHAQHKAFPALKNHLQAFENTHGKRDIPPLSAGGVEYLKPIDIKAFRAAAQDTPTSTATFRPRAPESAALKRPSRT